MAIRIQISSNTLGAPIKGLFGKLRFKVLTNATRQAMNKTVMGMRAEINRKTREVRKLKVGEINRDMLRVTKAKGNNFATLEAKVDLSGKKISLIRFLRGARVVPAMAGIAAKKRKKVVVEVKPGHRSRLQKAFLAHARGGAVQIFRRKTKKRLPIAKQETPSLARIFAKNEKMRDAVANYGKERFQKEFNQALAYELDKLSKKVGP